MTEWGTVLAVFWACWLFDGARLLPQSAWSFVSGWRRRRAGANFSRVHFLSPWPGGWRALAADVPLALSPRGIANRPVGTAGRPANAPHAATAWRWEEIKEVRAEKGWLLVNGHRFCADTGQVTADELRALATLDPAGRAERIVLLLRRWLRPVHLRRRARVLVGRTSTIAFCNGTALVLAIFITAYLAGNVATHLPPRWADLLARALPLCAAYAALLHAAAVWSAWRALRRRPRAAADQRGTRLFSAAVFPPQALRLRALVGEGFFPPAHPLAWALAFAAPAARDEIAFQVVADLRWPIGSEKDEPLAREICAWHREQLSGEISRALAAAGLIEERLLTAPAPNGTDSCSYCPRCRSQFTAGPAQCAHGVALLPLSKRPGAK